MVSLGIDMVHTDDIGAQGLHESSVQRALLRIDERIIWCELVRNTYSGVSTSNSTSQILGVAIPFMKNCLPSLVKNLLPVAVMVGRALTATAPATAENQESFMVMV